MKDFQLVISKNFLNIKESKLVHLGIAKRALKLGVAMISDCHVSNCLGQFLDTNLKFEHDSDVVFKKWTAVHLFFCAVVHWCKDVHYDTIMYIQQIAQYALLINGPKSENMLKTTLLIWKEVIRSRKTISWRISIFSHGTLSSSPSSRLEDHIVLST